MHTSKRRRLAGGLVAAAFAVALALGAAVPAQAVDYGTPIPGVPHPNFPNLTVYYDDAGEAWHTRVAAVDQNNALKLKGAAALEKAQAVPGSFWKRETAAVKAGTSSFPSVSKVVEQGNLTKYNGAAVLVKEGKIAGSAAGATKAASSFLAPATRAATLAKTVAGATVPMVGLTVGMGIGNVGARLYGFKDDMVCQENNGILTAVGAVLNGVDCTAYQNRIAEAQRNIDASAGYDYGSTCIPGGRCYTVAAKTAGPSGWVYYCLAASGSGAYGQYVSFWGAKDTNGNGSVTNPGSPSSTGGCSGPYSLNPGYQEGTRGAMLAWAVGTTTGVSSPKATVIEKVSNPQRAWACTHTYADGTTKLVTSDGFYETDPQFSAVKCPTASPGQVPTKVTVKETGAGVAPSTVYDQPTTPEYQQLATSYPECVDGSCLLDLRTAGASCFEGESDCAGWFDDPGRDTAYSCKYGAHDVALTECYVYADLFKQDVATGGRPYADPETGAPITGGAMTAPSGSPLMDQAVKPADETRECFPGGWAALNPVNWVLQPVQCALEWAFVPRASVVTAQAAAVVSAWKSTPPGQVLDAIENWDIKFEVAGCDGASFPFTYAKGGYSASTEMGIPSACPGTPLHPFAVSMQIFGVLVFIVTAGLAIRRHAGASIGFSG